MTLPRARSFVTATIVLLSGCGGSTQPQQLSLTMAPSAFTLVPGETVRLEATLRDGAGNTVSGALSWTTSDPAVAQVDATGLVTGSGVGAATVSVASGSDTVRTAITVHGVPCLNQSGPVVTLAGTQTSALDNTAAAADTKFDASTAQFLTTADDAARVGGGAGLCYHGGQIVGQSPPSTPWSVMHDRYGMVVKDDAPLFQVEGVTIFDYGDGVSMDTQGDAGWTIRNLHVKYSRDDCVENDFLNSGTIDSSFFDGCYDGMSSLEYATVLDGSENLVVIRNSLWRLQAMDQAYSGPVPNHNAFWKWSAIGPRVALYGNVFRADQGSQEGNGAGMFMAPPPGKLADCESNVMVWLGTGAFPESLPTTFDGKPCFTLMTGAAGLAYWNNAVAQWKSAHPSTLSDIAAPVVSLFSPGVTGSSTFSGSLSITATAVDDDSVVAVVFRMNSDSIGTVTAAVPLTKYTLTWDSHGEPNGTYALTATARDAAGHATTSDPVTVTVAN